MNTESFIFDELSDCLKDIKCECNYIPKTGPNEGVVCGRICVAGKMWCKKHIPERMKKRNESKAKKRLKKRTKLLRKNEQKKSIKIKIPKKDNKGKKINKDITSLLENLKI